MSLVHQNWWFTTLLIKQFKYCPPLSKSLKCDVLIVFAGSFAAQNILGTAGVDYKKYYRYFSNRRHFSLPFGLAKIIGKPLVFSLTNAWAKFYQVDSHRKTEEMKGEF
jgi:hypothetical protein